MVNKLSAGDRVVLFETGHFSQLWREVAVRQGIQVDYVPGNWRSAGSAADLEGDSLLIANTPPKPCWWSTTKLPGERVLLPAVRNAAPETIIVSDGFSCREQIFQATGRKALHLAEALQLMRTGEASRSNA